MSTNGAHKGVVLQQASFVWINKVTYVAINLLLWAWVLILLLHLSHASLWKVQVHEKLLGTWGPGHWWLVPGWLASGGGQPPVASGSLGLSLFCLHLGTLTVFLLGWARSCHRDVWPQVFGTLRDGGLPGSPGSSSVCLWGVIAPSHPYYEINLWQRCTHAHTYTHTHTHSHRRLLICVSLLFPFFCSRYCLLLFFFWQSWQSIAFFYLCSALLFYFLQFFSHSFYFLLFPFLLFLPPVTLDIVILHIFCNISDITNRHE